MHPEMALLVYRQQERELEETLRRRLRQTCCAALGAARRSAWSSLVERVTRAVRSRRAVPRATACCA